MKLAVLIEALKRTTAALEAVNPNHPALHYALGVLDGKNVTLNKRQPRYDIDTIIAEYRAGLPIREIASRNRVSQYTINNVLRRQGEPIRKRIKSPKPPKPPRSDHPQLDTMKVMRDEGRTLDEIGAAHLVSRERVRQILNKAGIPTPRQAYVLTESDLKAVEEYQAGGSLDFCAAIAGVCRVKFKCKILPLSGVVPRPRIRMPSHDVITRREKVAELYLAGLHAREIAKEVGFKNPERVYQDIAKMGISVKRMSNETH
jgi:transposase